MKNLLKYFLVGAGIFAAVFAFLAICTGIVAGIGYVIDNHPLVMKIVVDITITVVIICFLTLYGWLICN